MAHVVVRRGGGYRDALRRYTVLVNGRPAARLKSNSAAHIEVPEGVHFLECMIDAWGSPKHAIFASLANTVVVNCVQTGDASRILKGHEPPCSYLKLETQDPEDCAREYLRRCVDVVRTMDRNHSLSGALTKKDASTGAILLSLARHDPGALVASVPGTGPDRLYRSLVAIGWLQFSKLHEKPAPLQTFGLTDYGRAELLDLLV